jgi:alpha/beta superfamily hydrolase
MRRDDVELAEAEAARVAAATAVRREPLYLGTGSDAFFAWYHECSGAEARDCVAVICPPVGYEYTRSHRSLRHLADRLARAGIPALRFDYHGIGDSTGSDLDPLRLETWQANVEAATQRARELSGRSRVCLIGVRLGGSLAALAAAARHDVDLLVLWNACVTGRPYLRELQAIAASAEDASLNVPGLVESGGFVMTDETREAISRLDLSTLDPRVRRVLIATRDDMTAEKSLPAQLATRGVAFDTAELPGWSGMMAEHQFTVVPEAALDRIVAWVASHTQHAWGLAPRTGLACACVRFAASGEEGVPIEESAQHFGDGERLFGILARPQQRERPGPLVILFNAGAVHHVGPNRTTVEIARALAANGIPSLRFDLETLGDSVLDGAWRENYPYPRTAMRDVAKVFEFARDALGYERVVAAGLCSGAHMSFHAALAPQHTMLDEAILINPLVYYWVEGMSLDTSTKFEDMAAYRKSMRDPARWKKLFRGEVNMKRLLEVLAGTAVGMVKPRIDALHEILLPRHGGTRLSRDLRKLMHMKRPVTFVIGDRDQGVKILEAEARRTLRKGLHTGALTLHMIAGGDHTFSRLEPRRALVRSVVGHCLHRRG